MYGPQNDLFSVWGSIDLVFVQVVRIDLVFVCWSKITGFSVSLTSFWWMKTKLT